MMNYITAKNIDSKTDEWLRGVRPFAAHELTLDAEKSTLLVIDCQNYFVSEPKPDGAPVLPRIVTLIEAFRKIGRPVIFTRHMHKKDGSDLGRIGEWWAENIFEGTPESELHPLLGAREDDIVIRKNRYSSFLGTALDEILKNHGTEDVVVSGVMTNLCCETTARDAFMRDYRVFFPADANGTSSEEMHFASLINIAYGFGMVTRVRDVVKMLG